MADECLLDGVLDSLEDIGYTGPLLEDGALRVAVEGGLSSSQFVELCLSLCSELKTLNSMQETVTRPQGPEDEESFHLEMRSFLLELACPHSPSPRACRPPVHPAIEYCYWIFSSLNYLLPVSCR